MKVYIASKYIEHKEINQKIYEALLEANINAFLPQSINVDAITSKEMFFVSECCYDELDECDIILIVTPFGKSVSSEIGYAIFQKRKYQNKKLVLFNQIIQNDRLLSKEAMIIPYIDAEVNSIQELITYINTNIK